MARLVLFGAGDIAKLAHYYFTRDSEHEVVAFTVDRQYLSESTFLDLPVVPFEEVAELYGPDEHEMFIALSYAGMNRLRAGKFHQARGLGYRLATYVSSRCSYLSQHEPGENCFILEDNTVQPFVRIGDNVTLWSGNHVGHDSSVGAHCFVTSHVVISGNCRIGEYCFLGVNATLRNSLTIAERTLIGAGAVVMADTVAGGVYLPPRAALFEKSSDEIEL